MLTPPTADPAVALPDHLRLTAQEELWAIPLGLDPHTEPLPERSRAQSPRAALEAAVQAG